MLVSPKVGQIFTSVEGLQISSLTVAGDKAAVLLVHGNSTCKEIFAHQIDFLRKLGHSVVAPDLPGHGQSENAHNPRAIYSFPGYASILLRLMLQLRIDSYHIVGWSLGGHVGLEMWWSNSCVRSLMVTGTPPVKLSASGAERGFKNSPLMRLAGVRTFGPREIDTYGTAILGRPLDRRLRHVRAIGRTDGRARYWMVKNGFNGQGMDEVIAVRECPRPLAIVQGKNDPFVNTSYLQTLSYKNLWLKKPILMNAGHAPHWEKPRLFNRYMRDFLEYADRLCQNTP